MIYLIIGGLAFVICVVLQVLANDRRKKKEPQMSYRVIRAESDSFNLSMQRDKQLIDESRSIIATTNDLDVLNRRYETVLEAFERANKRIESGVRGKITGAHDIEDVRNELAKVFNNNACRIARHISSLADTPRKAKNAVKNLEFIKSELKDCSNRSNAENDIDTLIKTLNKDEDK